MKTLFELCLIELLLCNMDARQNHFQNQDYYGTRILDSGNAIWHLFELNNMRGKNCPWFALATQR